MRRSYQGSCPTCGEAFLSGYPYRIYCSPECRQEAASERMRNRRPLPPARAQHRLVETTTMEPAAVVGGMEVREWHGTPISRRADGYVNATAMCKANGKHLPHYMANDRTEAYIAALAPVVGIPTTALVESRQGGTPSLQGTWIHPRLAVDLARWISPAFAVWMDGWFLETLARGAAPHHHQPTTPGITVAAPTEREARQLWQAAIEAETTRALRLTLGVTGRTDAGMRPRGPWRFVPC